VRHQDSAPKSPGRDREDHDRIHWHDGPVLLDAGRSKFRLIVPQLSSDVIGTALPAFTFKLPVSLSEPSAGAWLPLKSVTSRAASSLRLPPCGCFSPVRFDTVLPLPAGFDASFLSFSAGLALDEIPLSTAWAAVSGAGTGLKAGDVPSELGLRHSHSLG